jgi:hypothetical protein
MAPFRISFLYPNYSLVAFANLVTDYLQNQTAQHEIHDKSAKIGHFHDYRQHIPLHKTAFKTKVRHIQA